MATGSVYGDLLRACQQALIAQNLPGQPAVEVRKRVALQQDELTAARPSIVLVAPDMETVKDWDTEGVTLRYPVNVVYVEAGNRYFQDDTERVLEVRQKVRRALLKTSLDGVSHFHDVDIDFRPAIDLTGIMANFDVVAVRLTWTAYEVASEAQG